MEDRKAEEFFDRINKIYRIWTAELVLKTAVNSG
jgi:hypothetical protein